jgi:glycosyltransferase involved in cell wall biosynthesis
MSFSIVIPLYNKALHIQRALNSVFEQTCQNFEIIVINDGSTDNGREIVENIHDARLRLINQSNQGVSAARNRGAQAARHEWVAFLDADDEWLPNFLDSIQVLIESFPGCGLYATAVKTVRPNGDTYLPSLDKLPLEPWFGLVPNYFEILQDSLSVIHSSAVAVPREILLEVGGFPEGIHLLEDVTCWVKIALRYPIAFNPKRMAIYHQDASNRSNIHKNLIDPPFSKVVEAAVSTSVITGEVRNAALDFVSQARIRVAVGNIMDGDPAYARQILALCSNTKKYKRKWLWWRFWAFFPAGWAKKLLMVKQVFTR